MLGAYDSKMSERFTQYVEENLAADRIGSVARRSSVWLGQRETFGRGCAPPQFDVYRSGLSISGQKEA